MYMKTCLVLKFDNCYLHPLKNLIVKAQYIIAVIYVVIHIVSMLVCFYNRFKLSEIKISRIFKNVNK